jgi:magnesium-transporting ATPase (P-type)
MNIKSTQHPVVSWHLLDVDAALHHTAGRREGLTHEEAVMRMSKYSPNKLSPPKKRAPFARFMLQFNNVLIYVMLAAGVITTLIGHLIDSGVILCSFYAKSF